MFLKLNNFALSLPVGLLTKSSRAISLVSMALQSSVSDTVSAFFINSDDEGRDPLQYTELQFHTSSRC